MAASNQGNSRGGAHARSVIGRSFASIDPERQREIITEGPRAPGSFESRPPRAGRPPHMLWMAPDLDANEGGSIRRGR
jgi:hypothetical protein